MNETFSVAPGGAVESYQPHSKINQIYGVWIDNFSGGWLGIFGTDLWCPPYTRGWKASIFPGISAITIRSYDFANGARIAGATGQAAKVTIWDAPNGDSEGIDFFDQQTIPIAQLSTLTVAGGPVVLVAAPAVGRIRLYEARLQYQWDNGLNNYDSSGLAAAFYANPLGITEAYLEISPASPTAFQTLVVPGGDLPIGNSLNCQIFDLDNTIVSINGANILIRYAVI